MEVQKPSDSEHFGEFPQQFLKLNALEEASSSDTEEKDKFACLRKKSKPKRSEKTLSSLQTRFYVESFNTVRFIMIRAFTVRNPLLSVKNFLDRDYP